LHATEPVQDAEDHLRVGWLGQSSDEVEFHGRILPGAGVAVAPVSHLLSAIPSVVALAVALQRSRSISTPGSGIPWSISSEAPPPVETWDSRSATPAFATAAAVSPPPTTVVAPLRSE